MICTGNSPTQVEAIAESVGDVVREKLGEKPVHVVGLENAQWVAMDYTDVLVHIFLPDVREYYDLEHLWEDAPIEQIPDLD
jgi:ribosome-associated protein